MVESSKDDDVVGEIGSELEMGFGERLNFVGEKRKVRVFEGSGGEFRGSKRVGLGLADREIEGGLREFGKMGLSLDLDELVEISGCVSGVRENARLSMEGVNVFSVGNEGSRGVKGKDKQIEKGENDGSKVGTDLDLDARENVLLSMEGVEVLSVENEGGGDNGKGKEIEKGENNESKVGIDLDLDAQENARLSMEGVEVLSVENEGGGDNGKGKYIEKAENDESKVGTVLDLDVRENAQLRLLSIEGDLGNRDDKGKGKLIDKGESDECEVGLNLDLDLGNVEVKDCVVESASMGNGKRRYTREEKGKAKVVDSWISLGNSSMELDAGIDLDERMKATFSVLNSLLTVERSDLGKELGLPGVIIGDQCVGVLERRERDLYMFTLSAQQRQLEAEETLRRQREAEERLRRQREAEESFRRQKEAEEIFWRQSEAEEVEERLKLSFLHKRRVFEELLSRQREAEEVMRLREVQRQRQAAEVVRLRAVERQREAARRERAHRRQCRLARPLQGNGLTGSLEKEQKVSSVGISTGSENLPNLFSAELNMHRELISKQKSAELIRWTPSKDRNHNISRPSVPSLLDLSLKVLADNADAIVSLETVPDILKRRLCYLLCDFRRMNVKTLDLFLSGSPSEIRIKDCSWITENEFTKSFESFDPRNLRVLQLDLCGQCFLDDIIGKRLGKSSNSLPGLGVISLRSACRLSDDGLKALVQLAPALCSINIGQCSLLTSAGIIDLANDLGSSVRELCIDYCTGVDAVCLAPVFKKFENLEVLSVAGILNVDDGFVSEVMNACGGNMKDLDLADCEKLTDFSLQSIGKHCVGLRALNIANLNKLSDWGLLNLADGCRSIQKLKLYGNDFSDKALATFLEMCGESIGDLSLNHVSKVGSSTALSLARCSKKLSSLDLSWCRGVTNEALGLIVDNCFSLKLLKLFGCTQITSYFLDGHSNSLVRIIGMNLTSVLEHVGMLEDNEPLLRYSPLPSLPES